MKAKAILTEGRKDIIFYLEKRNDKWASPVKVLKEAKTGLVYGGILKALKEMYEEGLIERVNLREGGEKPVYKFRCWQDLSGFKNLTKAVIDSDDVVFFLKYTSFPYFDKWCYHLIDDVVDTEGLEGNLISQMIREIEMYLKFSPYALKLALKKIDTEMLGGVFVLSLFGSNFYSYPSEFFDEWCDEWVPAIPKTKYPLNFFVRMIINALLVDILLHPLLQVEYLKAQPKGVEIMRLMAEFDERDKDLEGIKNIEELKEVALGLMKEYRGKMEKLIYGKQVVKLAEKKMKEG